MKKLIFALSILSFSVLLFKCTSTHQITDDYRLRGENKPNQIFVFTKDSIFYKLNEFELIGDTVISGSGYKNIKSIEEAFQGEIRVSNITYMLYKEVNWFKTIFAAGIITFIGCNAASKIFSQKYFSIYPVYGPGSCPYILSWNGNKFIIEGEAFGIGLGRALEIKTTHILNHLSGNSDPAKIRLLNERPETHYFNQIEIKAVETAINSEVYSDVNNRIRVIDRKIMPLSASGHLREDISEKIKFVDGKYLETNPIELNYGSHFEDSIELRFILDKNFREGDIIIHAINTDLSEMVFDFLGGYLGDDILEFYNSLETDPEMVSVFKDWINDISLKAYIRHGKTLQEIGYIYPEANSVPFSKAIHFKVEKAVSDTLNIVLKSMQCVWRIDAVEVGFNNSRDQKILDLPLISAADKNGNDLLKIIRDADNEYEMLLPSNYIDVKFNTVRPSKGKKISYLINARGFLYEWMKENTNYSGLELVKFINGNKINNLKKILKNKELFLPQIYGEWIKEKSKNIFTN